LHRPAHQFYSQFELGAKVLGTTQRNISAALVVGTSNFSNEPNATVMLVVGALLMLVILMVIGGELGRRGESKTAEPTPAEASLRGSLTDVGRRE
jgi:predicted Na+-dependent transporter